MHFSRTLCRMHRPLLYISLNALLIPTRKSRFESNWVYTFSCLCVDFSGLFVYIGLFYRSLYVHYLYLLERTDSHLFGCVCIPTRKNRFESIWVCVYLLGRTDSNPIGCVCISVFNFWFRFYRSLIGCMGLFYRFLLNHG